MATFKTYLLTDFPNDSCALREFDIEIRSSAITVALDRVDGTTTDVTVHFKADLSAGNETLLDAVKDAHDGVEESDVVKMEISSGDLGTHPELTVGGPKLRCLGTYFTATKSTSTVYDWKITKSIHAKYGYLVCSGNVIPDNVDVALVDKDGIVYPAGTVLHEYAECLPIYSDGRVDIPNDAVTETSLENFWFRITYNSTGATDDVEVGFGLVGVASL
jgi:hypothetical protein